MEDTRLNEPIEDLSKRYPFTRDYLWSIGITHIDAALTPTELFAQQNEIALEEIGVFKQDLPVRFLSYLDEMEQIDRRTDTHIDSLTILGGRNKYGHTEDISVTMHPGDILCIVGPTGSGKSRLLGDIECLAQGDTPTGRRILVDGEPLDSKKRRTLTRRLVAQLSQNMNYVMDLSVREFEKIHASTRMTMHPDETDSVAEAVIASANSLAGEKFAPDVSLTQLSGGQSRALMIADTALLSASPIILIDEIENAGIDRKRALEVLAKNEKIVLMATHDPILTLLGHKRLIIKNGGISKVVETTYNERKNLQSLEKIDAKLSELRDRLRGGETLDFPLDTFFSGTETSD
ncbi:MAG: ATP-binding cassette domain-containing protein [Ethanoligenens sp.]